MSRIIKVVGLCFVSIIVLFSILYVWSNSTTFQVFGEIIDRVETSEKIVALTFDDGPNESADQILAILDEHQVKATFYVMGSMVESHQREAEKLVTAGHEIGNHSYSHQRMVFKSPQFIKKEIDTTNALIRQIGYTGDITFRPPYGKKLVLLPWYVHQQNLKTITWDVEATKFLGNAASSQEIVDYVLAHTQPGSIILIHPWYGESNPSRDAIGPIIENLKDQGYTFVTISQLIR